MRLNETGGEFENIKSTTAVEKYKYADRKLQSLNHQYAIINGLIDKYRDRFVGYQHLEDKLPEEVAKGRSVFAKDYMGKTRWTMYHSLTPREIQLLSSSYKRLNFLYNIIRKYEKNMATLKRNAAKELGTFVSEEIRNKLSNMMMVELLKETQLNLGSNFSVARDRINIKPGRGDVHFFIKFTDIATSGPLLKSDAVSWKALFSKLKDATKTWIIDNHLAQTDRVAIKNGYSYDEHGKSTKIKGGVLEVRILIQKMADRYKKQGKW